MSIPCMLSFPWNDIVCMVLGVLCWNPESHWSSTCYVSRLIATHKHQWLEPPPNPSLSNGNSPIHSWCSHLKNNLYQFIYHFQLPRWIPQVGWPWTTSDSSWRSSRSPTRPSSSCQMGTRWRWAARVSRHRRPCSNPACAPGQGWIHGGHERAMFFGKMRGFKF